MTNGIQIWRIAKNDGQTKTNYRQTNNSELMVFFTAQRKSKVLNKLHQIVKNVQQLLLLILYNTQKCIDDNQCEFILYYLL